EDESRVVAESRGRLVQQIAHRVRVWLALEGPVSLEAAHARVRHCIFPRGWWSPGDCRTMSGGDAGAHRGEADMVEGRTDKGQKFIGKELYVSEWLTIDQSMVTSFATTTLDPDWMHVDVARSRAESPYGGTIVQGFLMLSLVIYFGHMGGAQPKDTA